MSISDELERLAELRRNGTLSHEEFELAKRKVLDAPQTPAPQAYASAEQLEEIKAQNEVAQLDRQWTLESEQYMVAGRHGRHYIPNKTVSVIAGLLLFVFGSFWTVMAYSITQFSPLGFGLISFFPLFGVVFVLCGLVMSINGFTKAGQYEQAHAAYQRKRRELTGK